MAPPTQGHPIQTRYPADVIARLDVQAKRKGITRAELLRRYAVEGLERDE